MIIDREYDPCLERHQRYALDHKAKRFCTSNDDVNLRSLLLPKKKKEKTLYFDKMIHPKNMWTIEIKTTIYIYVVPVPISTCTRWKPKNISKSHPWAKYCICRITLVRTYPNIYKWHSIYWKVRFMQDFLKTLFNILQKSWKGT